MKKREYTGNEIAIVGFNCRVPGAQSPEEFWSLILDKQEPLSELTEQQLRDAGVSEKSISDAQYVKKSFVLPDADKFDAAFFSMTPKEAEILDPQQRMFLELCWGALEYSGNVPAKVTGRVGCYAGIFSSTYLMNLYSQPGFVDSVGEISVRHGNEKDYLTTRLAYKLDLTGPCVSIQTSCSSSLVAVHSAVQGLLLGETDIALAGGVSVVSDQLVGYQYQEGGLTSPDGRCRPFDADAKGTVFSNGMGVVVLKRLEDAVADNDTVYAVLLGSAINNDGAHKVGFTAPSPRGQSSVIADAMQIAGVNARTIGLVEAHGTGTPMGDPIEVEALSNVYRQDTDDTKFCAIGSVKSNLGHLGVASGVLGLIKACLALHHRVLPPTINFSQPNPSINFETSPFHVITDAADWPVQGGSPNRAAVSSFGMGGTNAHVILESYESALPEPSDSSNIVLKISAKNETSLNAQFAKLSEYLRSDHRAGLKNISYTLNEGREDFSLRMAWVQGPEVPEPVMRPVKGAAIKHPKIAFAIPGQGSQFIGMATDLYHFSRKFAEHLDAALTAFARYNTQPLREALLESSSAVDVNATELAQPMLFIYGYAKAQLLKSQGVQCDLAIGHSIGELLAATLAGVFSLDTAAAIVTERARLMGSIPQGSMLSVSASSEDVEAILDYCDDVSIAAINGPSLCVLSGDEASLGSVARMCEIQGFECRELHTSHAFHSFMMQPAAQAFESFLRSQTMSVPQFDIISNITGEVLTPQQAISAEYWAKHIVSPVNFHQGLTTVARHENVLLVDLGPSKTVATLAAGLDTNMIVIVLGKHPKDSTNGADVYQHGLASLWVNGVDYQSDSDSVKGQKVALPTYQFDRHRYWVDRFRSATQNEGSVAQASSVNPSPINIEKTESAIQASEFPKSGTVVEQVTEIWKALFGISDIAADENFFALGGTSLIAIQMVAKVRDAFGVELNIEDLFEDPTISGITAHIEKTVTEDEEDEEALLLAFLAESDDVDLENL
jgi:acyl transferase domain-containing protein